MMASVVVAGFNPRPVFDRRWLPLYIVIGAELLVAAALYRWLGLSFANVPVALPSTSMIFLLFSGLAARRIALLRIAAWLEGTALIYGQGFAGWLLLFPMTVLARPFADEWLSAIDSALGFDFVAFKNAVDSWPILDPVYHSFDWQAALIVPALVLVRRDVVPFAMALAFAMMLTVVLYPLAPAIGPSPFYGLEAHGRQANMIVALRDHGVREITPYMMVGMVSFPSFHAATSIIFAWAVWPVRVLRWPFAILNAAVLLATVPIGDHYLIDVVGGSLVGMAALGMTYLRLEVVIGRVTPVTQLYRAT